MADAIHLAKLKMDVGAWNQWRKALRGRPDLNTADLHGAALSSADLSSADLIGANLSEA